MKLFLFFIDGVGIGENDKNTNPFKKALIPNLNRIMDENIIIPTDACLGIPGLPQSATGQTAIFTGINVSKLIGRHISGVPNKMLVNILNEHSLLKRLKESGLEVSNANVYTKQYFELQQAKDRRYKPSTTTIATRAAGISFKMEKDMLMGNGVYQDITNEILRQRGIDVPISTPEQSAHNLLNVIEQNDFTLFEYFQTDMAGHSQDMDKCVEVLTTIDRFIGEIYRNIDFDKVNIIITSDHGNIEDISTKTHTYNYVPTILIGDGLHKYRQKIKSIEHITPVIMDYFLRNGRTSCFE